MDIREIGREDVYWVCRAQGSEKCRAVVNTLMNSDDP